MSIMSIFLMILLFFCETLAFARTKIVHSIEIDSNAEETIALNFNITLYDLHCDFASVGKLLIFTVEFLHHDVVSCATLDDSLKISYALQT